MAGGTDREGVGPGETGARQNPLAVAYVPAGIAIRQQHRPAVARGKEPQQHSDKEQLGQRR